MPKIISSELEGAVKALSKASYGPYQVKPELEKQGHAISISAMYSILNCQGERRQAKEAGLPQPRKSHPVKIRTFSNIKKIDLMTSKENPPSQNDMARMLQTSWTTIRKIHEY